MAFQVGTRVRPELGNADFSGFARAAEIQASALANLGRQIGEGIEKYQTNKQVTLAGLASLEGQIAADPTVVSALENAGGDVGKSYSKVKSGNFNQRDLLATAGFVSAYNQQKQNMRASQLENLKIQSAQSEQQQKEKSRSAFDMAFMASREAETGKVDTGALAAAYFDQGGRDPNDLKIIESMQKIEGPNIEVLDLGGFKVVTQDGKYIAGFKDGKTPTTSALTTIEGQLEQLQRARKLYNEGDDASANDIIAILGKYKNMFGMTLTAKEVFGPRKDEDPNNDSDDNSSDLEDAILNNQATTDNVPTPEEIEAFNQAFLKPNPQ